MAFWAVDRAEHFAKVDIKNSLVIVQETTDEALDLWLFQQQANIQREAERQIVIEATEKLLDSPREASFLTAHPAQADLRDHFQPILDQSGDLGIFVIAPDDISLASMRDTNIGTTNLISEQRPDLLARVFQGETLLIPPIQSDVPLPGKSGLISERKLPTMFIASPIRNSEGQIIAVLTIRIDPSNDFSRITQLGSLGESGETYAFDKDGILMTESRFTDQLIAIGLLAEGEFSINQIRISDPGVNLTLGKLPIVPAEEYPLTTMAQSALTGVQKVNVEGYRDYRGVEVFGAWLWNQELGVGLATEINAEEALAPYYRTRKSLLLLMSTTLVVSMILALGILYVRRRRDRDLRIAYQALQSSEQQNRSILENTVDAIISIDNNNLITSFNRAAERTFGYSADEVLGENVRILMPEPDHNNHETYVTNFIETQNPKVIGIGREVTGQRKDGSPFPLYKGVSEFFADGERYFTSVLRDITLEKEAERTIQAAREVAERASLTKSEFLSNVSHELRTPLNSLMGVTYLAEDTELTPQQTELLDKMKLATSKLKSIIDTILDFSNLRAGELEIVAIPFNIKGLVNSLADEWAPKADEKGLAATFDIAPNVPSNLIGDPDRIQQVLAHLTENAIKFTEEGEIEVRLEISKEGEETVTLNFSVRDTGIGMTAEHIFELFQPFTQLDGSSTRRYGGLGMGLILSKQIVAKMGGDIAVRSQLGEGSVFSFSLSFARPPQDQRVPLVAPEVDHGLEAAAEFQIQAGDSDLNIDELSPLFQDLSNQLKASNASAIEILENLMEKIPSPVLKPPLKQLERLIKLYEFDKAHEKLTQLMNDMGIGLETKNNE